MYIPRLKTSFSGNFSVFCTFTTLTTCLLPIYSPMCLQWIFGVELECWTEMLNCTPGARQCCSARPVELVYVLELLHWLYFFKKLVAARFAGYRRAASNSRRTESCNTTSFDLGRKSQLRHSHSRRQKIAILAL